MTQKVKTKLKINHVAKNKNATIEKGRNDFNFVCSLFFIINTPPKDARTKTKFKGLMRPRKLIHQYQIDHEIMNQQIQKSFE